MVPGAPIFPIVPGGKRPLTEHGFKDASSDPEQVARWREQHPGANVAMPTGAASGIDVLDLDVKDGRNGRATYADLQARHGQILNAPMVSTPSGGLHVYFRHRDGMRNAADILPGVDIRGDGGYVLVPPSSIGGKPYEWVHGLTPKELPPPEWPAWLVAVLDAARAKPAAPPPTAARQPATTLSAYGRKALDGLYEELRTAAPGHRDDLRNKIAYSAGRLVAGGHVTESDAIDAILSACAQNGLLDDLGEAELHKRVLAGVTAGIEAGGRGPEPRAPRSARPATEPVAPSDEGPPEPIPPSEYAETATTTAKKTPADPMEGDTVLIPGRHVDEEGRLEEVGNDDFAREVLEALEPGVLYRIEREVGMIDGARGSRQFRALTETGLRLVIDAHVRLGTWVKVGRGKSEHQELRFVPCSKDHAALVLEAAATHHGTRQLKNLVSYPVYLPGLVLAKPGWNEEGGVFYDEPPSLVGVAPKPEGALGVLDDLVVDFPLKDAASRQNLYAAMLTLVTRPAISGPTPFFLVMASLERTGKGKLIDTALGNAIRGVAIPPMQASREEAEMEKRITAQILSGASVVHLDNIPIGEVLDSASLASLATAYPNWQGRKLGGSTMISLPNRVVVMMSANNPKATGELVKRTVPITLEPKDDHPQLRDDFKHPDCYAYALLRRPEVLSALLGIVEIGRAATPRPKALRMGGFEAWSDLVTTSLLAAGAKDLLANYAPWCRKADEAGADIEALIEKWATVHSGGPRSAAQILEMCEELGIFPAVLSKPTPHGRILALSRTVLAPLTDRPVRNWIVQRDQSGSNSTYSLKSAALP